MFDAFPLNLCSLKTYSVVLFTKHIPSLMGENGQKMLEAISHCDGQESVREKKRSFHTPCQHCSTLRICPHSPDLRPMVRDSLHAGHINTDSSSVNRLNLFQDKDVLELTGYFSFWHGDG